MSTNRTTPDVELRLALVCYGGVSLAVYMHGVTKELHKLIRASRRFDETPDLDAANPFTNDPESDTEHGYFEALRCLARNDRRVSVTVDIIAGTSAGGINGVMLGKAIACNASQDSLKRLWIDEGDLKRLLRAPSIGGIKLRAAIAAARLLVRATNRREPASPLRGERMSQLLVDAMREMDHAGEPRPTLILRGGSLDLYVTATDLHGFEVLVPTGAGGASQRERSHAQVLEFRANHGNVTAFGAAATPALAFASRATSSFPGAFAPVSIASFGEEVARGGRGVDLAGVRKHLRDEYEEDGKTEADAVFVDGGVLDNAPFDLAIQAIGRKRAETEVIRRVIYIQPDPGRALGTTAPEGDNGREAPSWLKGVWQALAGVKGSHSILQDLRAFRDMNIQIAEIGAIADSQMSEVNSTLAGVIPGGRDGGGSPQMPWDVGDKDAVQRVSDVMHERARTSLGIQFNSYCRLKALAAGRRLADEMAVRFVTPPDSSRASFVRAAMSAWVRSRVEWTHPSPEQLIAVLGPVDVPYRERRLHFLLAGINGLYQRLEEDRPVPPRTDLDKLKARTWDMLDELRDFPGQAVKEVPDAAAEFLNGPSVDRAMLQDPLAFAQEHGSDFNRLFTLYRDALADALGDGSTSLWAVFKEITDDWDPSLRFELLSRYLAFPLWDGLIFPTISLTRLPQFTPIGVTQCSPLSAGALATPEGGKLKGVTLHHFGAFLDAGWRENDYLWGRLDGSELLLRTLHASLTPGARGADVLPADPAEAFELAGGDVCRDVLMAVLRSETGLSRISTLREALLRELGQR